MQIQLNKKGDFTFNTIVKLIIALVLLLLLLLFFWSLRGSSTNILDKIANILRFG